MTVPHLGTADCRRFSESSTQTSYEDNYAEPASGSVEGKMEVLHSRCAGIDVHKRMVMTHARIVEDAQVVREIHESSTFTKDLLELCDWLKAKGVTHVAMESTGSYWKPVYNILEGQFEILVVNAHHIKNVPGRKTDVKDAEWIAELLAHGLLHPSFVPEAPQRALRDLTRGRSSFVSERARLANRIQKVLEEANVKLASVATDVLGASGRAMLASIAAGQNDPQLLAQQAQGKLRKKLSSLEGALEGRVRPHQRFMLGQLLKQVEGLDVTIAAYEDAIHNQLVQETQTPFEAAVALLQSAPGIAQTSARSIIAEIGADMSRFGSHKRLCAWSGVAPGNHQSGGKRLSGNTLHGNKALVKTLCEVANSAVRQKGTYLSSLYRRIATRRGKRRALMAVAHSILTSIFHMLETGSPYQDLGADHLDKVNQTKILKRLATRANDLGFELQPKKAIPA